MRPQAAQSKGRELRTRTDDALGPGSSPLKNPAHEKLARESAAGASMSDAWRAIGRDPAKSNNARRTFRRPEIQERIEYLRGEFNRMAGVSLAALQARYLRIADANVVDLFEADASTRRLRLRDLTTLPRVVTNAIAEVQIDAKGAVKIKPCDKLHALDSLLKTIGADPAADPDAAMTLEELILGSMQNRQPGSFRLEMATGAPNNSPGREPRTINESSVRRIRL